MTNVQVTLENGQTIDALIMAEPSTQRKIELIRSPVLTSIYKLSSHPESEFLPTLEELSDLDFYTRNFYPAAVRGAVRSLGSDDKKATRVISSPLLIIQGNADRLVYESNPEGPHQGGDYVVYAQAHQFFRDNSSGRFSATGEGVPLKYDGNRGLRVGYPESASGLAVVVVLSKIVDAVEYHSQDPLRMFNRELRAKAEELDNLRSTLGGRVKGLLVTRKMEGTPIRTEAVESLVLSVKPLGDVYVFEAAQSLDLKRHAFLGASYLV